MGIHKQELLGGASPDDLAAVETEFIYLQQQRIVECMSGAGYDYTADLVVVSAESFADLSSREFAEAHGFGVVDSVGQGLEQPEPDASPNARSPYRNTPEYATTLEACTSDASAEVNRRTGVVELRDLDQQIIDAIAATPEVTAATDEWQKCAAGAGFSSTGRQQMISDFLARATASEPADLPELKREEIAAAVGTFDCSVRFDSVWRETGESVGREVAGAAWDQ